MRISLIAADNAIYIDGVVHDCDCSRLLAAGVSALQWSGAAGEIEFVDHQQPNEIIRDLGQFKQYVDRAKPRPLPFTDNEKFAEEHAIKRRESDSRTRLGHFNPVPHPVTPPPSNDN